MAGIAEDDGLRRRPGGRCVMHGGAHKTFHILADRGRRGLPLAASVPRTVDSGVLPAGVRRDRDEPRSVNTRRDRRDGGRHLAGEDQPDHRDVARRHVRLVLCSPDLHPQGQRQTAAAGTPDMDGQAPPGGDPLPAGAYYEPQFRDCSHGFRPGRGCHRPSRPPSVRSPARSGSSRVTSKGASTTSTTRHCWTSCGTSTTAVISLIAGLLRAGYVEDWG